MALPRGIRNNNPLNIRKGCNWRGERPTQMDREFEEFSSMEFGVRAAIKLICNHINGRTGQRRPCDNLAKLIDVWAPPTENNTGAYIKTIEQLTGIHRYQRIYANNREMVSRIVQAMAKVETGQDLDMNIIHSAWELI